MLRLTVLQNSGLVMGPRFLHGNACRDSDASTKITSQVQMIQRDFFDTGLLAPLLSDRVDSLSPDVGRQTSLRLI